ncbi:carbon-nitrogen hydrolase family protein [Siculibacillus lacustris]|uniref:Carbon-nitrogen hydrolase family protein n=1 Tax=Siculibacillus lacustris TaxID=1549641 RepID=A0A4Q9VX20_9HYPH|nr:carbon-nitrogen hydrolase family protein [Siculibacillus lacustris]TBW40434.1 carbon-nitrogen hydrolase family protein [Siculibacillus lacustris]
MTTFRAALVQMRSSRSVAENVASLEGYVREAAAGGAVYVQTPETTGIMDEDPARLFATLTDEAGDATLAAARRLAAELSIHLHIGSLAIKVGDGTKAANRAFVIGPDGAIVARYDKIHLFDVQLADGQVYRESARYVAGDKAVMVDLPWGRLGVTICYDVRFPHLYRALAGAGAGLLAVPAAFTRPTGEAHWHVLLRARAIETGAWVLAAAQGGVHENGRETYGHSLVIDPWGRVVAEAGTEPGVIFADIDMTEPDVVRARVPSLRHDRPFTAPASDGRTAT